MGTKIESKQIELFSLNGALHYRDPWTGEVKLWRWIDDMTNKRVYRSGDRIMLNKEVPE